MTRLLMWLLLRLMLLAVDENRYSFGHLSFEPDVLMGLERSCKGLQVSEHLSEETNVDA